MDNNAKFNVGSTMDAIKDIKSHNDVLNSTAPGNFASAGFRSSGNGDHQAMAGCAGFDVSIGGFDPALTPVRKILPIGSRRAKLLGVQAEIRR